MRVYGKCDKQEELPFKKIYNISVEVSKNKKKIYMGISFDSTLPYTKTKKKIHGFNQNSTETATEGVLLKKASNFIKKRR